MVVEEEAWEYSMELQLAEEDHRRLQTCTTDSFKARLRSFLNTLTTHRRLLKAAALLILMSAPEAVISQASTLMAIELEEEEED